MSSKYNTDKTVMLQGKEYILFEGLLECAHSDYDLKSIETNIVQLPNKENGREAIIHAKVTTTDGDFYTGVGDASPDNVNSKIAKHLIRMAETRAIGRALRFLTGFGTVFEELGDLDEAIEQPKETKEKPALKKYNPKKEPSASKAQENKIQKEAKALGLSVEQVYEHLGLNEDKLTKKDASTAIKWLKTDEAKELGQGEKAPVGTLPF